MCVCVCVCVCVFVCACVRERRREQVREIMCLIALVREIYMYIIFAFSFCRTRRLDAI